MSRLLTLVRNDFRHALRDRFVWGATVLLGLMWLPSILSVSPDVSPIQEFVLSSMGDLMIFSLVVIAVVGYNSVTGERASGTVRLILGLPSTRDELVLSKLVSRLATVAIALGTVLLIASGLAVRAYGVAVLLPFWVMAGWIVLYAIVWTVVAVGYSAAFSSQYRALSALVVSFALFSPTVGIWRLLVHPLFALAFTGSFSIPQYMTLAEAPQWFHVMRRSNPLRGFAEMASWSITVLIGGTPATGLVVNLGGLALFVCCSVLPLRFGMRRFNRVDLNEERGGPKWSDRLLPSVQSAAEDERVETTVPFRSISANRRSRAKTIMRGDLNRTLKNWVVQGVIGLFVLLVAPGVWQDLQPTSFTTPAQEIFDLAYLMYLPVIVLATAVGYQAIVGEREAGTIRYVLGLPGTRWDLVVGKVVARLAIVVTAITPILLFAWALAMFRFGRLSVAAFLATGGWLLLVGVAWTMFAVGVSAAVSSRYRALAVILCSYVVFSVDNGLWGPVVRPLIGFVSTGRFATPAGAGTANELAPAAFRYLDVLSPLVALEMVLDALTAVDGVEPIAVTLPTILVSVLVVVLFGVGSLYVGYRRFDRVDL